MRTITLEEHFSTPKALQAHHYPSSDDPAAAFMKQIQERLLDVGPGRIAAMDKHGITHQVLSLSAGGLNSLDAGLARELADEANSIMANAVSRTSRSFQCLCRARDARSATCRDGIRKLCSYAWIQGRVD